MSWDVVNKTHDSPDKLAMFKFWFGAQSLAAPRHACLISWRGPVNWWATQLSLFYFAANIRVDRRATFEIKLWSTDVTSIRDKVRTVASQYAWALSLTAQQD
jgi:hypothetical protein